MGKCEEKERYKQGEKDKKVMKREALRTRWAIHGHEG